MLHTSKTLSKNAPILLSKCFLSVSGKSKKTMDKHTTFSTKTCGKIPEPSAKSKFRIIPSSPRRKTAPEIQLLIPENAQIPVQAAAKCLTSSILCNSVIGVASIIELLDYCRERSRMWPFTRALIPRI